ncbi:unnamed protein product [Discula destructiva]
MEPNLQSKKGRFMGKLFGRDRKVSSSHEVPQSNNDLNDFLRRPDDPLPVAHPGPQMLQKLDIATARRYPNAHELNSPTTPVPQSAPLGNHHVQLPLRARTQTKTTRRSNKKGLVVRFVDTIPEIIGEGGDECALPTAEIGKRRRAQSAPHRPSPPIATQRLAQLQERDRSQSDTSPKLQDDFVPPPIKRTQTGLSHIRNYPDSPPLPPPTPPPIPDIVTIPAGNPRPAPSLDNSVISNDEKRKSFIEVAHARQREAEGMAFAEARRSMSASTEREWEEQRQNAVVPSAPMETYTTSASQYIPESPDLQRRPPLDHSPGSVYSQETSPVISQRWPSVRSQKLVDSPNMRTPVPDGMTPPGVAPPDDALEIFLDRTRHLFALFRLSAEVVKPVTSSQPNDLARAALWWFLKGRTALETSIRDERRDPQHATQRLAHRQQAYADLAKTLWIFEEVLPQVMDSMGSRSSPVDAEVQDVGQTIMSQLRKLSSSMKRNGFLPPAEAFLPQTIDKTIWLEYPAINQDIIALLWGSWSSAIAAPQGTVTGLPLLAALPVGDTTELFCFNRYMVDLFLMEQGMEDQKFYFPCFLSVTRAPTQATLDVCIASQNGAVQLRISSNKKAGPSWTGVKWRSENCTLELKLPRGFIVVVKLRPQDFKALWGMQDFSAKAATTLQPRNQEQCVFRSALRSFQYFDSNPHSLAFPKEPVPGCEVALFEKIAKENSPTGPRVYHRGFRLAVVTSPAVKLLSAITHLYTAQVPIQFGFLRGEHGEPALLLRFDEGKSSGRMVMTFHDEPERLRFHGLLIGTLIQQDEKTYSEVPILGYSISETARSGSIAGFSQLPWSRAKIINEDVEDTIPDTVLSERLRLVVDFKCGSITDRINVGPGEMKIRLPVKDKTSLMILRPTQQDMTVALSESQTAKQLPGEMYQALQLTNRSQTVRTISFTSQRDLHEFQEALTGFKVHFDGAVSLFAISRRRMVVPIYKKWEATETRIQIVESEDKIIQVLVFFENFHHGQCMSFQLKATDVFESIKKGDKVGLKIDDAKFPLPLLPEEKKEPTDDMAFVCLDMPEIPGEHDDITILFEGEEQRDDFIKCLPAPVKGSKVSNMFKKLET